MEIILGLTCAGLGAALILVLFQTLFGNGERQRLRRLEGEVQTLRDRLLSLEQHLAGQVMPVTPMSRRLGEIAVNAAPVQVPEAVSQIQPTPSPAFSVPQPESVIARVVAPRSLTDFALPDVSPPPPAAAPSPVLASAAQGVEAPLVARAVPGLEGIQPEAERKALTWEERIGGQWLNWLGGFTLVVAVGLLLKWIYDLGLLAPLLNLPRITWVILGWLLGGALVGGGLRMRRCLPAYGQGLAGAGIAVGYVATYAGLLYQVLSPQAAIPAMAVAGLMALGLAWKYDEPSLAWLGVVSAYAGPLLLGMQGAGAPELFLYVTGLNVAVLGVSLVRRWPPFRLAALLGTALLYAVWSLTRYQPMLLGGAVAFLAVNSGLFLLLVAAHPLRTGERSREEDLSAAALNPVLTTVAFLHLFWLNAHREMGWVAGISALAYWAMSRLLRARLGEQNGAKAPDYLEQLWFAASLAFLVLCGFWSLGSQAVTPAWAVLGAVLSAVGYGTGSTRTRNWGLTVLLLSAARLVVWDVGLGTAGPAPFLDERSLAFASVILGCGVAAAGAARAQRGGKTAEEWRLVGMAGVAAAVLDLWIWQELPALVAPVGWSVVAGLLVAFGWQLRSQKLRITGLVFSGLVMGRVSLWVLEVSVPLRLADLLPRLPALLSAAVLGLATAWRYARPGRVEAPEREPALPVSLGASAVVLAALTWLSLPGGWLEVAWVAGVLGLLWGARTLPSPSVRVLAGLWALGLSLEAVGRQTGAPVAAHWPLLHDRGVALLCAAAAWTVVARAIPAEDEAERPLPPLAWSLANLFALGWVSLEAMDLAPRLGPAQWSAEAAKFGLSAGWLLYAGGALAWGFLRDQREARVGAMLLLLVTVVKVYLFDLAFLALGYRVLSFLALAAVLLAVSYAYQRRGHRAGLAVNGRE